MSAIVIEVILGVIFAAAIVTRYIVDNKNEASDIRSRVSENGEDFWKYTMSKLGEYAGLLIVLFIVTCIVFAVTMDEKNPPSDEMALHLLCGVTGAIWLLIYTIKLPFSKADYKKWINRAPERKAALDKEQKEQDMKDMCSWIKGSGKFEFAKQKFGKFGINPSKVVQTSAFGHFIVDNENKKFVHFCVANDIDVEESHWYLNDYQNQITQEANVDRKLKRIVNDFISSNPTISLQIASAKEAILDKCFHIGTSSQVCEFKDLIRVEIVDKTQVDTQRTYTMESNAGKAIAGAFLGEFLMGGVPSATVGAIAGAAGERTITENVVTNKTIAYDVVLYLNRLDNSTYTIRVNSESELRELAGVLEYILNNK